MIQLKQLTKDSDDSRGDYLETLSTLIINAEFLILFVKLEIRFEIINDDKMKKR